MEASRKEMTEGFDQVKRERKLLHDHVRTTTDTVQALMMQGKETW